MLEKLEYLSIREVVTRVEEIIGEEVDKIVDAWEKGKKVNLKKLREAVAIFKLRLPEKYDLIINEYKETVPNFDDEVLTIIAGTSIETANSLKK